MELPEDEAQVTVRAVAADLRTVIDEPCEQRCTHTLGDVSDGASAHHVQVSNVPSMLVAMESDLLGKAEQL